MTSILQNSPASDQAPSVDARPKRRLWSDQRGLFLITVALAALVYAQFELFKQPVRGDRANWEYMAQLITRGGVPYRDAVNIKSPLSAYLGAAAIVATRPFGLRDVYAVRLLYISLAALTVAMVGLVCHQLSGKLRAGLLASMIFLAFDSFPGTNSAGIQPKTPMILFGIMSLWALMKGRPFWAGFLGMLSALSWQPGLLFVGAAGLAVSRYLTRWRSRELLRLLLGAALPLAIMLVYFWSAGALRDLYLWSFRYNYSVYAPFELKSSWHFWNYMDRTVDGLYSEEKIYFLLAMMGLLIPFLQYAWKVRTLGLKALLDGARYHAVGISALAYAAFCQINVQGSADFFPFLPFTAIFASLAIISALDLVINVLTRAGLRRYRPAALALSSAAVLVVVFFTHVTDAFSYHRQGLTFQDQEADVSEIASWLEPGEKVFVHGSTEVLVIGGFTNASRYFFLDRDKDVYMDQVEPGGFDGWFKRLRAERPKIVLLTRMRKVRHKNDFYEWVKSEYEQRQGSVLTYYIRKGESVAAAATNER